MKQIKIPYLSHGLWRRLSRWRSFFADYKISVGNRAEESSILGWGYKPSGKRAIRIAEMSSVNSALLIEDGFLRSMDLGVNGDDPLSLVVDDLGIYYDTTKPSSLEQLILDKENLVEDLADAAGAMSLIFENKLTKYNHILEGLPAHLSFPKTKKHVLVIDQTFGDMSLVYGSATAQTFQEMLESAIVENPTAKIWIKIHPDVLVGKRQGHYSDFLARYQKNRDKHPNIEFLAEDIHPHSLLERMDKVYAVTSQMGFEALLYGKEVITFGIPWYAGWGLTDDRNLQVSAPEFKSRRQHRTLLELFTASYLQYCRYINPFTNERGTIFDVIDYLIMMKEREKLLQGEIWIVGLSWWKRQIMTPFLKTTANQLRFFKSEEVLKKAFAEKSTCHMRLLLWGKKFLSLEAWASDNHITVLRMEDGFIRSVGLGSNLVAPRSLVIDDLGIYFDASKPSRLEMILEKSDFNLKVLAEAKSLQTQLIAEKIGKYNVGNSKITQQLPVDKPVLLVPGQVEDDASIQTGTREICTNLGLLKHVRENNPQAYIIYKPHPDVVSGNRIGNIPDNIALQFADSVMPETDIMVLIEQCKEVHTMTSLAGFEALLRDKKVFCYGIPFYAGWGLTTDLYQLEGRRKRRLSLLELIAGTLLLYPEYLNIQTGKLTNAKVTLEALSQERAKQQGPSKLKTTWPVRKYRQLLGLLQTLKW
ncbi:capsular polysaccharide biosynthesis protein [Ignatzschineria rhizosphaerae]|uniref:Capsular polysaccharide biosynthesis protein n=1 Tax=Ignatzschineria rhizosphaerae TaxID=2923279 RepID=A0ABY3X3L0_9GAMM|nr:capsular polysaccharide biosynthesis protein [Ignatzschineria rhizosphaerae]UNM97466.1 capsular polysaccharide biosynthesis protein [Ignatzschineria rhizosphaerae]